MEIMQLVMTGLWVLTGIAFAVVFVVKYKASPTGILGALGSVGHAVMAIAYAVVPVVLGRLEDLRPDQMQAVFGLLNGLNLVAAAFVFVAILLAPVPRRQPPMLPAA